MSDVTYLMCGADALLTAFDGEVIENGAVAWHNGRISAVGAESELKEAYPSAEVLDARGGVIVPGLVNLHHHFYSALARGLDPGVAMTSFPEVLDRLWWRLDRALDLEAVRVSAQLALVDCIRWGCTTVFDHHASPSAIEGSLNAIAGAVEEAGLSAVLCYEITDRNGADGAVRGLEENLSFLARNGPRIRGVMGLHASFTLRDETLAAVARRRSSDFGCHIHLAEDPADGEFTRRQFGCGLVERLDRFDLLDDHALLAHCIHLEEPEYARLAETGCTLLHNPESNANNGVGRLDPSEALGAGCRVGLGTDGMAGNMMRALRSAFLLHRHTHGDPSRGFGALAKLLPQNVQTARRFFDEPKLGSLESGAPADLCVIECPPPTSLDSGNQYAHLVYGMSEAPVRHTVARGNVLMRDFELTTLNPRDIARHARRLAPGVWRRFHELKWGTPYLG